MKTKFTSVAIVGARLLLLCATSATLWPGTSRAATITVTSTADSGVGTLRAALASASNGDTVDATGITGTILLTSGELPVTNSVTILGPGPANLAVDGNATNRVFHISSNAVTIAGLTITNGMASGNFPANCGGGIYTGPGALTVTNCTFSGNSAGLDGGGIYGDHSILTVSACTFTGNSANAANSAGGGIYNDGSSSGSATLTVTNCTLSSNSATYGAGIFNSGAARR
jgi:predicted outer membrane repeat protein